jgi:DNA polymerase III alpha subunit (gram-positive type)
VPRTYIALDLETTGLSAARDAIIEIGAVRFVDGQPVEKDGPLINPATHPYEVTLLTGTRRCASGRAEQVAGQIGRFTVRFRSSPQRQLRSRLPAASSCSTATLG